MRLNTTVAVSVYPHDEELLICLENTAVASSGHSSTHAQASDLDSLTGMPNRLNGLRYLHAAIVRTRQHEQSLAAILIDLDEFQEINNIAGYVSADGVLLEIARRIVHHASGSFVARMSGDEFLIVVEHARADEVVQFAHALLKALDEPLLIGRNLMKFSASVGISIYPDDNPDPDELLRNASAAMADAKAAGGDVVRMYDRDTSSQRHTKAILRYEMEQALIIGGFELHYQPQVSARWTRHGRRSADPLAASEVGLPCADGFHQNRRRILANLSHRCLGDGSSMQATSRMGPCGPCSLSLRYVRQPLGTPAK
ncbi:diguanylate cyclase/phosphodiesterase (GGDEF & EAL domain) with PAS/PAC sensor(s) (plasmid) [Cupriavidus necator H850]|nr:diguanylate cyclase/phosphodiesterase (GGDEF & EAL domain) with PAS/PAC sensor(s) [Cupriavidus necator H850]